jgi:4-amino-4-deoxy-L-arabinose transferase-like glycosyltransferase
MLNFPTLRVLGFVGRFALVYLLLTIPWPGWNGAYSHYFQALCRTIFAPEDGKRLLTITPYQDPNPFHQIDTRITLSNHDLLNQPKGSTAYLDLDTRSIGWVPTALTAALILATALPWRRRAWALFWGLFWIHVFIIFSVSVHIWYNSEKVSLVTFSPIGETIAEGLDYTLLVQLGVSFSMPVLIWILVTFRRKDVVIAGPA